MGAEQTRSNRPGRPAIDWNEAFLYYAALAPERRCYAEVAAQFAVSPRTVERHGREQGWKRRARALDAQAAATVAARLVEARAATLSDLEKLVEATLIRYAQNLREGSVRLGASDLARLHKLLRDLWGEGEPQAPASSPSSQPQATVDAETGRLEHKRQKLKALFEAGVLAAEAGAGDTRGDAETPTPAGRAEAGAD